MRPISIRKQQILIAAEKIISEKGPNGSNISEIAQGAGVQDSIIYKYFKGKEDLLFTIPFERMKDVIAHLNEHLQGIRDPESRLRKMIWFHLVYNDTHRDYIRLVLLECRSNKNFYQHEAYNLIRKYAGIMLSILEDGVKRQVFRSNVNMRLIRDIIFGVLDWECLSGLAAHEIEDSVSDLEDIMTFILPMIRIQTETLDTKSDKSTKILKAAEKVFSEKGYNKGSIFDIAKMADVSEGTIYEYFKNKEDLLLTIAEQRFGEYIDALEEVFETKKPLKKLQRFIRNHFYTFLTERNFLRVFLLNIQFNRRFYSSHVYETFRHYTDALNIILEEGKKDGSIRPDVNIRVFKNLFLGAFGHMALRWLILPQEGQIDKMVEIDELVLLLLRAVAN